MRIIATMMVRDEIDIVAAMIEHHLDQGVDTLIVTDNGSVDGTAEVLERYAETGRVELHHDPRHLKQQATVVTEMARRARTHFRADWVLNLDADEFLVPRDKGLNVRGALARTPLSLNSFHVPVVNLVGPAAFSGSGIGRLEWRDQRSDEDLLKVGLHAQPTPNAVHRGESDIEVVQGNHFVSLPSNGEPPEEAAMEVLHLPWRSWAQLERKVVNAGRAYEANPEVNPSPRHHGMRDYRRYLDGWLQDAYLARTPTRTQLAAGKFNGAYVFDDWLTNHLRILADRAIHPDLLRDVIDPANDKPVPEDEHAAGSVRGLAAFAAEPMPPARAYA